MADLIFVDANGNRIISDKDPTGVTRDFGQIIAGDSSSIYPITIYSTIKVSNVIIKIESIPSGDIIEISKSNNPFIPSQQINFDGVYDPYVSNIALMSLGGSVNASSSYNSSPSSAFDGDTNTYWATAYKSAWITRDLSLAKACNGFRFLMAGTDTSRNPTTTYSLEGSNDGTNWNYIINPKTIPSYSTTQWRTETFPKVLYQFYRCSFSLPYDWFIIYEIELISSFIIGTFYVRVKPGEDSSGSKSFRIKAKATPV